MEADFLKCLEELVCSGFVLVLEDGVAVCYTLLRSL